MPSSSFPFFASIDSSSLKAVAFGLTNPARKAVNDLTATLSPIYDWASTLWPSTLEEPFFVQAQREVGFQQFQAWCADVKKAERTLLNELLEKKLDPKTFRALLLTPQKKFTRNIISPIYYQERLIKLEQKFNNELKLPPVYGDIVTEAQARFRETLQTHPNETLTFFYHDMINHLIQLSGYQISAQAFLKGLTYYQGLVPKETYQRVLAQLEHFVKIHAEKLTNQADLYLAQSIPAKGYQLVLSQINAAFALLPKENSKVEEKQGELKSSMSMTPRFLMMATVAALSVSSLQMLPDPSSLELAKTGEFLYQLTAQNKLLSNWAQPWVRLSQATLSFGLFHSPSLSHYNPRLGYIAALATLFPVCFAQSGTLNLASLDGSNGFMVNGIRDRDFSGFSLSSGDINGDNITDLLIGAYGAPAGSYKGQSYVVFGSHTPFPASFNLGSLNGRNGFVVNGINNGDDSSASLSSGDINGDGITDLLIGAPNAPNNNQKGQSYVVFGSKTPFPASFNLTELNGSNGFIVNGINNGDFAGNSISSGDINGDDITDLLIGALYAPANSGSLKGQSYVVFGSKIPFPASLNLADLNGTNGFMVNGINNNDHSGASLSSGDINGDNITDLLIGAYGAPAGNYKGQNYVVFGSHTPFPASFNLGSLNGSNGFVVNGINNGDLSGASLSCGGINGDNITDLLIGAYGAPAGNHTGQSYVVFGSKTPFPASFNLTELNGSNGFRINGINIKDNSGFSLSSGDINGDGITDLLIGAPNAPNNNQKGQSYVVFGSKTLFPANFNLTKLNGSNGFVVNGINNGDASGSSLSSGDINGDGIRDLLIGAPDALVGSHNGQSYVVFGSKNFTFTNSGTTNALTTNFISTINITSSTSLQPSTTPTTTMTTTRGSASTNLLTGITSTSHMTLLATATPHTPTPSTNLIVGIVVGTLSMIICISGITVFLVKKRPWQRYANANQNTSIELQDKSSTQETPIIDPLSEPLAEPLSALREEKKHTRIGGKYDLLNQIYRDEAAALLKQTGVSIVIPFSEKKTKVFFGKGKFGKVRLARNIHTQQFVALKKIKGQDEIEHSRHEAKLQMQLKNLPHIMPLLDSVEGRDSESNPVLYQFMPLASLGNGDELKAALSTLNDTDLKQRILLHITQALLTGLKAMHSKAIFHFDLKTANFVIDQAGNPFVIDFGCAMKLSDGQVRNKVNPNGDTRYYSPERIAYCQSLNEPYNTSQTSFSAPASDCWSLGLILLELAKGAYPFESCSAQEKLAQWTQEYLQDKLYRIEEVETATENSFWAIVKGLLAVDPQLRLTAEQALGLPLFHSKDLFFSSPQACKNAFTQLKMAKGNELVPINTAREGNTEDNYAYSRSDYLSASPTKRTTTTPGYANVQTATFFKGSENSSRGVPPSNDNPRSQGKQEEQSSKNLYL